MSLLDKFPHLRDVKEATQEECEELEKEYYSQYQGLSSEWKNYYLTAIENGMNKKQAMEYAQKEWEEGFKYADDWADKNKM